MKISTTNLRKKDGAKLINGYKVALQKTEIDRLGMGENTELFPKYEDGKITLIEVERIILDYASIGKLWCYTYKKIAKNQYNKEFVIFKMPTDIAEEIIETYEAGSILPRYNQKGKNLIWKDKEYKRLDVKEERN